MKTGISGGQLLGIVDNVIDAKLEIQMNGGKGEFNDKIYENKVRFDLNYRWTWSTWRDRYEFLNVS